LTWFFNFPLGIPRGFFVNNNATNSYHD
jgi:hypothetical protein